MRRSKKPRRFKNEDEERGFWASHDVTDCFDVKHGKKALFPRLKPTTESISLRLPGYLLARIRELAGARDVPYQSLMKIYLSDRVSRELGDHL